MAHESYTTPGMAKHFQLLDFLRRVPMDLLQEFFAREDVLAEFDWGPKKRVPAERVATAMEELERRELDRIVIEFRKYDDLAGILFTRGVLNEARFHNNEEAIEQISAQRTHLGKTVWTFLNRPDLVPKAVVLRNIDLLPDGAWEMRPGMPSRPGPVDPAVVEALQDALIEFFTRTEHRGKNCKIDCLRRGDEELFFAYSEDHPDSETVWADNELVSQARHPAFEIIFKHNDKRRILEIHIDGDRTIVPKLQVLFARVVLGEKISEEFDPEEHVYELARLLKPGFRFRHSDELGIEDVNVNKMRFVVEGEPWRRFMAEANTAKDHAALGRFVADLTSKLEKSRLCLDQVCINVVFKKKDGDRVAKSRTLYVTYPSTIRMKKDEYGELIAEMLVQSGVQRDSLVDGE